MHRLTIVLLAVVMLLGTVLVGSAAFASQEVASPDYSDHPLVGSWVIDPFPEDPENPLEMGTILSDGTMVESAADGSNGHGVWEPTGDRTAIVTFLLIFEDGFRVLIRGTVEVAPDGQSFTSPFTNEFFDPETGEWSGEIGPGMAEGTRITLEAPGTPVASFEEFFGAPEGTPEATPAG